MPPSIARPELETRLLERLSANQKVLLLVGPRGSGKSTLLKNLLARREETGAITAFVNLEPIAAAPEILCERFLALAHPALRPARGEAPPYARLLGSLANGARGAALLLDEIAELRTLSYIPGIERPLETFLEGLSARGAPSSLATSRFGLWLAQHVERVSPAARSRIEILALPPLTPAELRAAGLSDPELLLRVTGGLPLHAGRLLGRLLDGQELEEALFVEIAPGGRLETECRATLGELLHRARGYAACKSVLRVLATEDGLTLSEVARRIERTAGATRDYLRWLEEVALVQVAGRRFSFVDPMVRLWLRIYAQGGVPSQAEIRAEVGLHLLAPGSPAVSTDEPVEAAPIATEDLIEID